MATITTNLKIPKPEGNEYFNRTEFNNILDVIDQNAATKEEVTTHKNDYVKHPGIATTTNNGNAYVVTLDPAPSTYENGMGLVLTINADSTGACTVNVNRLGAKPIKKANGNAVTNLKKNGVYTLRYSTAQSAFILQGEGGSGNATASDILSGKTASTDNGDIVGTMVNQGAITIKSSFNDQSIPSGYHNGNGKVTAFSFEVGDTLIASNDSPKSYTSTLTKMKAIIVPIGGVYRVKYTTQLQQVKSQLYINDSPVGIERTTFVTTPVTYTEDVTLKSGDEISIYGYKTGIYNSTGITNFRLYVDSVEYIKYVNSVI